MSEHVIDVTRRSRVRALAARMHRVGIADVFSTGAGTAVDEATLSDEQRAEAAKVLEEVTAGSLSVEDVETAAQTVAIIRHYAKPSCAVCHGTGVVRRNTSDDVCGCVDRRWQAKSDREAANLHTGSTPGARTREIDREERIAKVRRELTRARDVQASACANLDAKINAPSVVEYLSRREQLNTSMVASMEQAEVQERLDSQLTEIMNNARSNVETVVLRLEPLIQRLFDTTPLINDERERTQVHTIIDEAYVAAFQARQYRADQEAASEAARTARAEARACLRRIEEIDADNVSLIEQIQKLRTARTRTHRRHQTKIDRLQKTLRRLTYLAGGSAQEEQSQDEAPMADDGGTL